MPPAYIGQIVHFYITDPAKQSNGHGVGPYPAIVTQAGDTYANLKVLPPFAAPYDAGSVSHRVDAFRYQIGAKLPYCWWEYIQAGYYADGAKDSAKPSSF